MATGRSNLRGLILLLLTSGFFIIGLLFDYMPMIVDNQIKRSVELATNEELRSLWSKPPIDLHSYYWLFAVDNVDEFMLGEKARVRKIGPYHFTSRVEKKIIDLSANKYRLFYNSTRHMKLNESAPNPELDERQTFLNPIYASVLEGVREFAANAGDPQMRQMIITSSARLTEKYNESLFINTTARTALVGRKVEFIEKAKKLAETFGVTQQLPKTLPGGLFGFVAVLNGTWSGPFEIYTGYQASMPSLGDIISFQGRRRLTEFQGRCNRLQASAGELRPMPIGNNQILEMFQPSFCRILHLQPTGTKKMREGQAISYVLAAEDFMGAESNPDNRCFCVNGSVDNYCSLNGVLELAPCNYYSPIVITANNMQIDPRITDSIHNWDPELISSEMELAPPVDNSSQILILKRIGVPMQADVTLVLFMKVIRDTRFKQTVTVPEVSYIPVLMVREMGSIPPALGQIVVNVESFLALTYHIKVVMYLSALVLLGWLTGHYYNRSTKDRVVPSSNGNGHPNGGGNGGSISGSERANSADSSKSQRPSRVSQSSMDPGDMPAPLAMTEASGNHRIARRQTSMAEPETGNQTAAATTTIRHNGGEDGQIERRIVATGSPPATAAPKDNCDDHEESPPLVATDESAKGGQQGRAETGGDEIGRGVEVIESGQVTKKSNQAEDDQPQQQQEAADAAHDVDDAGNKVTAAGNMTTTNRKNWFMKVCSNFVRMLNGIRSTINDAGQLDISENEYQDKQLELLAGKIDNWQRYSSNDGNESNEEQATATAMSAPADPTDDQSKPASSQQPDEAVEAASEMVAELKRPEEEPSELAPSDLELGGQADQLEQQQPAAAPSSATTASIILNDGDSSQAAAAAVASSSQQTGGQSARQLSDSPNKAAAGSGGADEIDRIARDGSAANPSAAAISSRVGSGHTSGDATSGQEVPAAEARSRPSEDPAAATEADSRGGSTTAAASVITETKTVKRTDSVQSNQTIINRSDTSGSSLAASEASRDSAGREGEGNGDANLESEDKAKALEQMEIALNKKTGPLFCSSPEPDLDPAPTSNGDEQPGAGQGRAVARRQEDDESGPSLDLSTAFNGATADQAAESSANVAASARDGDNSFWPENSAGPAKVASSVVMINSSTSMDSILDGPMSEFTSGASSFGASGDPTGPRSYETQQHSSSAAPALATAAGHLGHNQSVKENDQIDESSLAALEQSNKLLANGVANNDCNQKGIAMGANSATTNGTTNQTTEANGTARPSIVSGPKDERRDSGVKLDSRKGPGGGLGNSDTATAIKRAPVDDGDIAHAVMQELEKSNGTRHQLAHTLTTTNGSWPMTNGDNGHTILSNDNNNNDNSNNDSVGYNNIIKPLAGGQTNRQQQIKSGSPINGHGYVRTKLLNGPGNNISNGGGKILFQQRQTTET